MFSCHHGRRAKEENIVYLHDAAEAKAAGFRPCKSCRPVAV
jgi:methylphosphotriester-DNA--protein-cysteine methyltransferase